MIIVEMITLQPLWKLSLATTGGRMGSKRYVGAQREENEVFFEMQQKPKRYSKYVKDLPQRVMMHLLSLIKKFLVNYDDVIRTPITKLTS